MKNPDQKFLIVLSLCLLLLVAVSGVVMARRQAQTWALPEVISKVKDLEVVSVSVRQKGEGTPSLAVEIRNKSDKAVIGVMVESGDDKDASGIHINGDADEDEQPSVIIAPYGTRTVELPMSNLLPGKPVKVAGAFYADGSEDGEAMALSSMLGHLRGEKAETLKRKGGSKQQ